MALSAIVTRTFRPAVHRPVACFAWGSAPGALGLRDRRALGKPDRRMIHLPVRSAISFLEHAEKWLLPVLPFTAGQLSLFVNDSIARPDPLAIERLGAVSSVQESLQRLVAHG